MHEISYSFFCTQMTKAALTEKLLTCCSCRYVGATVSQRTSLEAGKCSLSACYDGKVYSIHGLSVPLSEEVSAAALMCDMPGIHSSFTECNKAIYYRSLSGRAALSMRALCGSCRRSAREMPQHQSSTRSAAALTAATAASLPHAPAQPGKVTLRPPAPLITC